MTQTLRTAALASLLVASHCYADIDGSALPQVRGIYQHSPTLVSAGLPSAADFAQFQHAGVEVVINVIPPQNDEPQPDVAAIRQAGLIYYNVPFDEAHPVDSMEQFRRVMAQQQGKSVLVHCAANIRASGMVYLKNAIDGHRNQADLTPWEGKMTLYFTKWPVLKQFFDGTINHYGLAPIQP